MFSSFEKIMCLQSLFLSDSECSGGAYYNVDMKWYKDCSAGADLTRQIKFKYSSDGMQQNSLVGINAPSIGVLDCPEMYSSIECTCDAFVKKHHTMIRGGKIYFDTFSNTILLVT